MRQRRLPPALGCVAKALVTVQALPLIEHVWRKILRHEEMAPRHNACRDLLRVPDSACASKVHQLEHKLLAQRGSGQQSTALLETDVDIVHMPLLRVSSRRRATAEQDLPALDSASRRPAVQWMRRELGDECRGGQASKRAGYALKRSMNGCVSSTSRKDDSTSCTVHGSSERALEALVAAEISCSKLERGKWAKVLNKLWS